MIESNDISRRSFLSNGVKVGGAVVLAGATGGILAACGSSGSSSSSASSPSSGTPGVGTGTPVPGGSLTVAVTADIDGFYPPSNHWDTNGFNYANAIYDPLCAVGANGTIQPYLCQAITPNSTFDTWTMTLRPNVKFSDGTDLTASIVVSNFAELRGSYLTGQALTEVIGVSSPDLMTVIFQLDAPNPNFPAYLTIQAGYMVGQSMIDAAKNGNQSPTPVGTGPFVFQSWEPNSHFTATRNPHYWRKGLPYLDQITFRPIPDTSQREATLKSSGVDMLQSVDPGTITRFQGQSSFQLVDTVKGVIGEPSMGFLILNTAVAPTNNLQLRKALAQGLDSATLAKIFNAGLTGPSNGLFLKDSPYYSDTGYPSYDPGAAKKAVAQYTAEHGQPKFTLSTIPDPVSSKLVQIAQQMWNQIGCDVTIVQVEQAAAITNLIEGDFQAAIGGQFGAVDPNLNYFWWSTTTVKPVGQIGLNFSRNNDPVLEQNLLTGRHTTDQSTRIKAYQAVNERLAADLPYMWIAPNLFSEVATQRVQNFANPTLPSGGKQYAFNQGQFFPTQIWLSK
jgi:ABC-type transport system substrate-binding protein